MLGSRSWKTWKEAIRRLVQRKQKVSELCRRPGQSRGKLGESSRRPVWSSQRPCLSRGKEWKGTGCPVSVDGMCGRGAEEKVLYSPPTPSLYPGQALCSPHTPGTVFLFNSHSLCMLRPCLLLASYMFCLQLRSILQDTHMFCLLLADSRLASHTACT